MKLTIGLFVLFGISAPSFAIRCHVCNGWTDGDCDGWLNEDQFDSTCPVGTDSCQTVSIQTGNSIHTVRLCTLTDVTASLAYAYNATSRVCTSDLCNSEGPKTSNVTTEVEKSYNCYECESTYHSDCATNPEKYQVDCDKKLPGIFDSCSKVEIGSYVKRECGISFGLDNDCYNIGTTEHQYCTCTGDYCNAGNSVSITSFALLMSFLVAIQMNRF